VAELEKVRLGYLEASRKRKVLDKLKERQGEEVRRQQNRDEIAVLNEIATSRAVPWGEAGVSKP
jgi:flagellar export protein FliJ